jgi:hypothetical protein
MQQVAPTKTDAERLLVSPEPAEVLTAVIFRVRAGNTALPLVSAYDVFEQTWSARECLVATSRSARITVVGDPLEWRPHDFRRVFVTDAIRSGLPPHIAAMICGRVVCGLRSGAAARKDAELVPFRVGKYDPALIALADVGVSST